MLLSQKQQFFPEYACKFFKFQLNFETFKEKMTQ